MVRGIKGKASILLKCAVGVLAILVVAFVFYCTNKTTVKADNEVVGILAADGGTVAVSTGTGYNVNVISSTNSEVTFSDTSATPMITASANSGYTFDRFVSTRGTSSMGTPTSSSTTFNVRYGTDDHIFALFEPDDATAAIYYTNGRLDGSGQVVDPQNDLVAVFEPGSQTTYKTVDYITPNSTITGATAYIYNADCTTVFVGWSDGTNIVSTDETFVPSGNLIPSSGSVTYYPVYTRDVMCAEISVNDPTLGKVGYGSAKCDETAQNANYDTEITLRYAAFHSGHNYFDIPTNEVWACPVPGANFLRWEISNVSQSTSDTISKYSDSWAWIDDNDSNKRKVIVAVFEPSATAYQVSLVSNDANEGALNLTSGSNYAANPSGTSTDAITISSDTNYGNVTTSNVTITPAAGYVFDHFASETGNTTWSTVQNNQATLTMTGADTVTVYFTSVQSTTYVISTDNANNGGFNTTSGDCNSYTTASESVGLDANQKPDVSSYAIVACPIGTATFSHWELDGQTFSNNASINKWDYTWADDGAAHNLVAFFDAPAAQTTYTISTNNATSGGFNTQDYWCGSNTTTTSQTVGMNGQVPAFSANTVVACPNSPETFLRWELDGQSISTSDSFQLSSYQWPDDHTNHSLVAVFSTTAVDSVEYHVFTGYTGGNGFFDHNLPQAQRTDGHSAQAGEVTLTHYQDSDPTIPAGTASLTGDQHETAPNGYYFAYWITGCNTNYTTVEQVDDGTGTLIDYNVLAVESIVSTSTTFRPTAAQVQQCDEYIAVFYRKNQLRLIAQSENEAIAVVNATTRSSSQFYQDLCDNTLMRTKANLGVGVNASGFYSSCDATNSYINSSYEVDHWTINGSTVVYSSNGDPVRDETFRDPSNDDYTGFTILGDQLNYLVAHYRLKQLPYTGSIAIWFIIGGGIGLVAIPSVILIVSERKEQKKGGKK